MLLDAQLLPLKKAADSGDINAKFEMAVIFGHGRRAGRDDQKALQLFEEVIANAVHLTCVHNYFLALFAAGYHNGRLGNLEACDYWFQKTLQEMGRYPTEVWDMEVLELLQTFTSLRLEPDCTALP